MNKKIVFFGTEEFSARFLSALLRANYEIVAVVTKPDSKKGRGNKVSSPRVKQIAIEHDIPVWQPHTLNDIIPDISALGEVAAVLVSYGKIIPKNVIDCFSPAIINVHPSLLPRYRGPSPVETAILNGDTHTGVSIMKLEVAMDAGPVYAQYPLDLTGTESKQGLYRILGDIAEAGLLEVLPAILNEALLPEAQDDALATYCQLLQKADGLLDPTQLTAIEAERRVRAYAGFPNTRIVVHDQTIIITKAHIAAVKESLLDIAFTDETTLAIDELIAPSGKKMNAKAFIHGYLV